MIVNLTQEQIDFLYGLCSDVEDDYENHSVKQQKEREEIANVIIGRLLTAEDGSVDEYELDKLSEDYVDSLNPEIGVDYGIWEMGDAYKDGYKQALKDIVL